VQSSALSILRMIQEEAMKENTAAVHVHLPIDTATFLLNEKRMEMSAIESRIGTPIMIIPMSDMETPHYHIRRLRIDEYEAEADVPSYEIDLVEDEDEDERKPAQPTPVSAEAEKPVIGPLTHSAAPPERPKPAAANGGGIIKKIITGLFGKKEAEEKKPAVAETRPARQHQPGRGHGGGRPPHRPPHGQRHERHERHAHGDRRPGGQGQDQNRQRPPQPQQAAAGAPGGDAGQAPRERPEGGSGRRRRRGRRRGGRSQEGRTPQERQDINAHNGAPEANGSPDRPPAPRPPREETSYVPPAAATAGVTEALTETPAATSWDQSSEQNNDGWHTPSSPTSGHDETPHASDSGESAPKPELVQVETRFDDDKGNK
jgi:ribonuclease E